MTYNEHLFSLPWWYLASLFIAVFASGTLFGYLLKIVMDNARHIRRRRRHTQQPKHAQ